MKAFLFKTFFFLTLGASAFAIEGRDSGGGEFTSQEGRHLVSTLPAILRSKGTQFFPEIDMNRLDAVAQGKIEFELKEGITVNGSPKAAHFDQATVLIQVDPVKWKEISAEPNSEIRKRALLGHEIFGLIGAEKNNDYTVSNRLLGLEYLTMIGVQQGKDQVVPFDFNDPQIIYWAPSQDDRLTFFYCKNRNEVTTCRMLGRRSYSKKEIQAAHKKYKDREVYWYPKFDQMEGMRLKLRNASAGLAVAGAAIGVFVPPAGLTIGGAGAAMYGVSVYVGKKADETGDQWNTARSRREFLETTVLAEAPVAPKDFGEYVKHIHGFLMSLDRGYWQGAVFND